MWQPRVLDGAMGDVGQFCSLAVEAGAMGDVLHIAYVDDLADSLDYMRLAAPDAMGTPEVVDTGMRPDGAHPVGADARVVVDRMGAVRIVYQDQLDVDLWSATKAAGATSWTTRVIKSGPKGNGFYARIAVDGAAVWASDYVYDRMDMPFGKLEVVRLP
jgi:hypothetical protein